jgi:L-ribulose-5-phosphate 3-epimerase
MVTRRTAIALAAGALLAPAASPQTPGENRVGPKPADAKQAATPLVCGYSGNLAKVPYPELGSIAREIGYDGIDLTVMSGGHVNPNLTNVDLVRAIESVRGAGLEVPMISTNLTSMADPTAYPILVITGQTDVHLYRTGTWPWGFMPDLGRRTAEIRQDLVNLTAVGKQYEMVAMVPNRAGGFFGEAVWDANAAFAGLDPNLVGYYFDPSQTQAWEAALLVARSRLKAVAVQDFYWEKSGKTWQRKFCPLGEGMIDWELFFRMLAQMRFRGPLSIQFGYEERDGVSAMGKDIEFVRKQIGKAWGTA